jgi:hypothetical protein
LFKILTQRGNSLDEKRMFKLQNFGDDGESSSSSTPHVSRPSHHRKSNSLSHVNPSSGGRIDSEEEEGGGGGGSTSSNSAISALTSFFGGGGQSSDFNFISPANVRSSSAPRDSHRVSADITSSLSLSHVTSNSNNDKPSPPLRKKSTSTTAVGSRKEMRGAATRGINHLLSSSTKSGLSLPEVTDVYIASAAASGNVKELRRLGKLTGSNVDGKDSRGRTAAHLAVEEGQLESLRGMRDFDYDLTFFFLLLFLFGCLK